MVSDIGEQWSPNIPPLKTAPKSKGRFNPILDAIGMIKGTIIANVPQEVPVEKDMRLEVINKRAGIK